MLERERIPIGCIVGTSMGAIIGASYAQTMDSHIVESKIKQLLQLPLFQQPQSPAQQHSGPGSFLEHIAEQLCRPRYDDVDASNAISQMDEGMAAALSDLLSRGDIDDCLIPFAAVASDLVSGQEVILSNGPIVQAVLASSALPGVLSPVAIGDYLLVDGAATSAVPVRAAKKLNPRSKVVAVDVSSRLAPHPNTDNVLQIIMRSSAITGKCYHEELIKKADVLVQPHVKLFNWSEFGNVEDFIAEGEQAAVKQLHRIKKATGIF